MEPWAQELLNVWTPKVDEICQASMPSVERMWVAKYNAEDIAQMVRGCVAMVTEELEGRTSDLREGYFQTIVPAVAAQGERVSTMAAIDMAVTLRIAIAVIPALSPEHRVKATEFFVEWQARYIQEIVQTAIEAGAKP